MALIVPCLKGKMGNTNYYQATMKARELVHAVRPASELDNWADMGIEERMQREPNKKRILQEIAPYLAKSPDRFFGAVIVLIFKGDLSFERIAELGAKVPAAYKKVVQQMGFLTIDSAQLIVLDGQHRLLALEKVVKNEVTDGESHSVPEDDISVIFVHHENDVKTRRIFNKVNRYAKATSRGDNIITSEDDAYAIISRHLLEHEAPLGVTYKGEGGKQESVVVWKHNTLADRSTKFTTISAVYETVKTILKLKKKSDAIDIKFRPADEELETYYELVELFWKGVLGAVPAYGKALKDPKLIPDMREETAKTSLLFKPAGQIAVFDGLAIAVERGVPLATAADRLNKVDWSMTNPMWRDIIIKAAGNIDTGAEAREAAAHLIAYLISSEKMTAEEKKAVKTEYNRLRGYPYELPNPGRPEEELPKPVVK